MTISIAINNSHAYTDKNALFLYVS